MRFVVPAVLLLVALIHALPLLGVVSAARVSSLYGIAVQDSNLEILMRHRAVLFGLLAAFLAYAAFHRHLHSLALIATSALPAQLPSGARRSPPCCVRATRNG